MPETVSDGVNNNDDDNDNAVLDYLGRSSALPNVAASNIVSKEQTLARRSNSEYGNVLGALGGEYSPLPASAGKGMPIYDSVKPIKTVNYDKMLPPPESHDDDNNVVARRPKSQYSSVPAQKSSYINPQEKLE